jgi:predicted RNA-binding protein with PIN domain
MDTPLARISENEREAMVENLAEYLKNRQIILLLTDSEYTPTVRKRLKKHLAGEFRIRFEELKEGARAWIEPYERS